MPTQQITKAINSSFAINTSTHPVYMHILAQFHIVSAVINLVCIITHRVLKVQHILKAGFELAMSYCVHAVHAPFLDYEP